MPAPLLSREEIMQRLLKMFRAGGYQGTSMSMISKETGLGKASLYHHFPGGKEEMVDEVINYVGGLLQSNVLDPLNGKDEPQKRLESMIENLNQFYECGMQSCILESLSLSAGSEIAGNKLKASMNAWIDSMTKLAEDSGFSSKEASEKAEKAMVAIQGALIVTRTTGDKKVFERTMALLPGLLLKKK